MLKTYYQKEKIKNSETYSTSHGPLSQELISERYWFFVLICHVNQVMNIETISQHSIS